MPPRLFRVILQVGDIEVAAAFYATLLGLSGERVSRGRHYFDCGGCILGCFDPCADGNTFDAKPNPDHVYFAVNDPFGNPVCFVDAKSVFKGGRLVE